MLQERSIVKIADNTGAKIGRIFRILGGSKKRTAEIGDTVVLSVQIAQPRSKLAKKKDICRAVVVRQTKPFRRKDGSYVRFDENAVVIIDEKKEPKGSRVFGPIPREISERGYQTIISLAPEVV